MNGDLHLIEWLLSSVSPQTEHRECDQRWLPAICPPGHCGVNISHQPDTGHQSGGGDCLYFPHCLSSQKGSQVPLGNVDNGCHWPSPRSGWHSRSGHFWLGREIYTKNVGCRPGHATILTHPLAWQHSGSRKAAGEARVSIDQSSQSMSGAWPMRGGGQSPSFAGYFWP